MRLDALLDRWSVPIFIAMLGAAAVQKDQLLLAGGSGTDILCCDVPKSLMVLRGQDPYSVAPGASPYPPFFLMVYASIIRLTTSGLAISQNNLPLIAMNIRAAGLVGDLAIAVLVFAVLRARRASGLEMVVPIGVFLFLPSISLLNYFFFHGDVFGQLMLAGSLYGFVKNRLFAGSVLLSLATIFKVHPILSVPLMMVWMIRKGGLVKVLPSLLSSTAILVSGLVLPFWLPGFARSFLGFNLANGASPGTATFSLMNIFYGVLPSVFGINVDVETVNGVWVASTIALFSLVLWLVWSRSGSLGAVDVVLLGLLVWLLPLRELYPFYLVWAIIPFLMRARAWEAIVLGGLFEIANTLANWAWKIPPDPYPWMDSPLGYFIVALALTTVGVFATASVFKQVSRGRTLLAKKLCPVSAQLGVRSEADPCAL